MDPNQDTNPKLPRMDKAGKVNNTDVNFNEEARSAESPRVPDQKASAAIKAKRGEDIKEERMEEGIAMTSLEKLGELEEGYLWHENQVAMKLNDDKKGALDPSYCQDSSAAVPLPVENRLQDPTALEGINSIPGAFAIRGIGGDIPPRVAIRPPQENSLESSSTCEEIVLDDAVLVNGLEDQETCESDHLGFSDSSLAHFSESEIIEGTVVQRRKDRQQSSSGSKGWHLVFVFAAVGVLTLVAVLLLTSKKGGDDQQGKGSMGVGMSPTTPPTSPTVSSLVLFPPFSAQLQKASGPDILKATQELGSPYYFANIWMRNDPFLSTYSLKRQ